MQLLNDIIKHKIHAVISGVFAEPLDKSYLGKLIDKAMIAKLAKAAQTHSINPAGEGGEIETTVLFAPGFKKKLVVKKSAITYANYAGTYAMQEVVLQ